jgi:hypothetical protein
MSVTSLHTTITLRPVMPFATRSASTDAWPGGRSQCLPNPAWSDTLACAEVPCSGIGRSRVWPAEEYVVPHREDEESKQMMHEPEKSDFAIVATKPANEAGQPVRSPQRTGHPGIGDFR